jgi:RHS repeat-associated protein
VISSPFVDANGHNNGNAISIANYYDPTRSQQFTYDQLNRIATAETTSTYATSPTHCWGEAYVYDNAPSTTIGEYRNLTNINVASTAYNGCTQESLSVTANTQYNNNQITAFSYDASGNVLNDTHNSYTWNAESEIKSAAGVTYTYDGDGNRLQKSSGKIYWYGSGSEVLDESDSSGNITDEYVYFGGKRVSHRVVSTNALYFYGEDMLGTSRTIFTSAGVLCYDADFYPFGGERAYTNTCAQNYTFEGKERDTETGNDDFGARYYSSSFGRWTSPDWSAIPAPVPYANVTNPQTLNLYAMVSDNPETFADLDGHFVRACNGVCGEADYGGDASMGDESGGFGHQTYLSGLAGVDAAAADYYQKEEERAEKEHDSSHRGSEIAGSVMKGYHWYGVVKGLFDKIVLHKKLNDERDADEAIQSIAGKAILSGAYHTQFIEIYNLEDQSHFYDLGRLTGTMMSEVPGPPGVDKFGDQVFNFYGQMRDKNNKRIDQLVQQMLAQ